jgi:branched-chain amino acid transport system ATP-binding protein
VSGFEVRDLTVRVPGATLRRVDLYVTSGELVGLLGDEGGSALLRAVAGVLAPANGAVRLDGEDLTARTAADVAAHGVLLLPAARAAYGALTVREHLRLGAALAGDHDRADRTLAWFPALGPYGATRADALPIAEAGTLVVATAVARAPRLLLVDGLLRHVGATAYGAVLAGLRVAAELDRTTVVVADTLPPDAHVDVDAYDRAFVSRHGALRPWHAANRAANG